MDASLVVSWLRAGVAAAAAVGLLDAATTTWPGASVGERAWLAAATFGLGLLALVPPALVALPLLAWRPVARAAHAATRPVMLRAALATALTGAGVALHAGNATLYVRLYLSLHLALGVATLVALQLAAFVALPRPAARAPATASRARGLAIAAAAFVAWCAVAAVSLERVLSTPARRFVAIERTTELGHGLLALHQAFGILGQGPASTAEAAALVAPTALPPPRGAAAGASVLLVTVDSLRPDALPAGGAMAALVAGGTSFAAAYAPSCWTIHAMSATLTSRLPSQLVYTYVSVDARTLALTPHAAHEDLVTNPASWKKVTPVPFDDPTPTLAEHLGAAGWQTFTPVAYVFYRQEAGVTRGFAEVDDTVYREKNLMNDGITSAALTDAALAFLARRDRARPFFVWIHYMDPHAPYVAHDDQARSGGGGARARYDSEVRLVDRELGRLLDGLRADGSLDDTLVVLHADHGEEFGEHGGGFHATTVYEETVRVPFVWRLPARAGGQAGVRATAVSLLDLAPTLLDLLGVRTDGRFVGRSLAPAILGDVEPPARPVLTECRRFGRDKRAVIDAGWKAIADRAVGTLELYDLTADPGERTNLVDRKGELAERLAGWLTY